MIEGAYCSEPGRTHPRRAPSYGMAAEGLTVFHQCPRSELARALIDSGHEPDEQMRVWRGERLVWKPAPLGEIARWTVKENDSDGLRRCPWEPYDTAAGWSVERA